MNTQTYNKLVRDHIIPDLQRKGIICEFQQLSDQDAIGPCYAKLDEEVRELKEATTTKEKIEEIADIMEVCLDLARRLGVTAEEVETIRVAKRMDKGGFEQNWFLISTTEPS